MREPAPVNLYALVLGLPEDTTDPDHYEILGLPRFTEDQKAIHNATLDQNAKSPRMTNLRLLQHLANRFCPPCGSCLVIRANESMRN